MTSVLGVGIDGAVVQNDSVVTVTVCASESGKAKTIDNENKVAVSITIEADINPLLEGLQWWVILKLLFSFKWRSALFHIDHLSLSSTRVIHIHGVHGLTVII